MGVPRPASRLFSPTSTFPLDRVARIVRVVGLEAALRVFFAMGECRLTSRGISPMSSKMPPERVYHATQVVKRSPSASSTSIGSALTTCLLFAALRGLDVISTTGTSLGFAERVVFALPLGFCGVLTGVLSCRTGLRRVRMADYDTEKARKMVMG